MASSDKEENIDEGHWLDGLIKPSEEDDEASPQAQSKPLKPGKRRPGTGQSAPKPEPAELTPLKPLGENLPSDEAWHEKSTDGITERTTSSLDADKPVPPLPVTKPSPPKQRIEQPSTSEKPGPEPKLAKPPKPVRAIQPESRPAEEKTPPKKPAGRPAQESPKAPTKPTLRPLHQSPGADRSQTKNKSKTQTHRNSDPPEYKVRIRVSGKSKKQRLVLYRALASMLEAGLPIFGAFEFLAEQAETEEVRVACRRMAMDLATGHTLPRAARSEPALFSPAAVRVLEVGMQSGMLVVILQRLADDEDQSWRLRNRIWGQMIYPLALAILALAAALLLPPLVLAGVLEEVVKLSSDPPAITVWILSASSALSSPATIAGILLFFCLAVYLLSQAGFRERLWRLEPFLWRLPWIGDVLTNALTTRFLQLFSLTTEVGLPILQGLSLSFEATGSHVMKQISKRVHDRVVAGESLSDSLEHEGLLPQIAVESIRVGEQTGKFSVMMRKAADIMLAELDYRIETTLKLIEPMLLMTLGVFVGIFAAGCLLPILKLAESL